MKIKLAVFALFPTIMRGIMAADDLAIEEASIPVSLMVVETPSEELGSRCAAPSYQNVATISTSHVVIDNGADNAATDPMTLRTNLNGVLSKDDHTPSLLKTLSEHTRLRGPEGATRRNMLSSLTSASSSTFPSPVKRSRFYDVYKKVPSTFSFTVMPFHLTAGVDQDGTRPVQLAIIVSGYGNNPYKVSNVSIIDLSPAIVQVKTRALKSAKQVKSKTSKPSAKPTVPPVKSNGGFLLDAVKSGQYALLIESVTSKRSMRAQSQQTYVENETEDRQLVDDGSEMDVHAIVSLVGDINDDLHVAQDDLNLIQSLIGTRIGDQHYLPSADANCDGKIDQNDINLARKNLGAWIQSDTKSSEIRSTNEAVVEIPNVVQVVVPSGVLKDGSMVMLQKTTGHLSQDEFEYAALFFQSSADIGYDIRIEISSPQDLTVDGFVLMTADIPDIFLDAVPPDHQIEVFAKAFHGSLQDGVIPTFALLASSYNSSDQSIKFKLPLLMFFLNAAGNYESVVTLASTPGGVTSSTIFSRNLLPEPGICRAASIRCPLDSCTLTASFGMWNHPITNEFKMHFGADYKASIGQSVYAAASGTVLDSRFMNGYGNTVVLRHLDRSSTLYAHLSEINVAVGQTVDVGNTIAKAGNTGTVTGPNLHFEYVPNGAIIGSKDRIDPNPCISLVTKGSITTGDNGNVADDSFELLINGMSLGVTAIGSRTNNLSINNLRPGTYTLELVVVVAPDNVGTFYVQLNDGLKFADGSNRKEGYPAQGTRLTWSIIVPHGSGPVEKETACVSSALDAGECIHKAACFEREGTFEVGKCLDFPDVDVICCFTPPPCTTTSGKQGHCMYESQCSDLNGIVEVNRCPKYPDAIKCCYQPTDTGTNNPEQCSSNSSNKVSIASLSKPKRFVSRYDWKAGAYKCGFSDCSSPTPMVPKRITIHHTASSSNQGPFEIQKFHQDTNGWCDVGYHFLIDRSGLIFQGRPFTTELGPGAFQSKSGWPDAIGLIQGAHVLGENEGNIGIALIGCFDQGSWCSKSVGEITSFSKGTPQYESLIELIRFLSDIFAINVKTQVKPHNFFDTKTVCPGVNVNALFDAIILEAAEDPKTALIECHVGNWVDSVLTGFCASHADCLKNSQHEARTDVFQCRNIPIDQSPVCCLPIPAYSAPTKFDLRSYVNFDMLPSTRIIKVNQGLSVKVSCELNSGNPKLDFISQVESWSSDKRWNIAVSPKKSWIDNKGKSLLIQFTGHAYAEVDAWTMSLEYTRVVRFTCHKFKSTNWTPIASDESKDISFVRKPFVAEVLDWWAESFFGSAHTTSNISSVQAFIAYQVGLALLFSASVNTVPLYSAQIDEICESPDVPSVHNQKQDDLATLPSRTLLLSHQAAEFSHLVYINNLDHTQVDEMFGFFPSISDGKWRKDQAFVAKMDNVCYGAFQGSIPLDKLLDISSAEQMELFRDWGDNANAWNGQKCGCSVRRGFLDMYNNPKYMVDFRKSVKKCVHSCSGSNCELVLTGHSQGGALAVIAAIDFHIHNPYVFTFGAPPSIHRPCKYINEDRVYQYKNTVSYNDRLHYDAVSVLPFAAADIGRHFILGDNTQSVAHYMNTPPNLIGAIFDSTGVVEGLKALLLLMLPWSTFFSFDPYKEQFEDRLSAFIDFFTGAGFAAHDRVGNEGYNKKIEEIYLYSTLKKQKLVATGFDTSRLCRANTECISNMCKDSHCALLECTGGWDSSTVFNGGFFDGREAKLQAENAQSIAQSIPSLSKVRGGDADAFEKCYWNCVMVIHFGKTADEPQTFSNLYPTCFPSQRFEFMNLHNSKIGRVYGQKYARGNSDCERFCLDGVSNGNLYTDPIS